MTSRHLLTIIDIICIFSIYISFSPKKHTFSVREFDVLIDPSYISNCRFSVAQSQNKSFHGTEKYFSNAVAKPYVIVQIAYESTLSREIFLRELTEGKRSRLAG